MPNIFPTAELYLKRLYWHTFIDMVVYIRAKVLVTTSGFKEMGFIQRIF